MMMMMMVVVVVMVLFYCMVEANSQLTVKSNLLNVERK